MVYVMSDIHGCLAEFEELLGKMKLTDADTLYVLGDVVDRGPDPVGVLERMAESFNIVPIVGNHEYVMLKVLPKLLMEIQEENLEGVLTMDFLKGCQLWMKDGGKVTADGFRRLEPEDREFLLDYVRDFSLYEEVVVHGRRYFLVHSLPNGFSPGRCSGEGSMCGNAVRGNSVLEGAVQEDVSRGDSVLENYTVEEIIFGRPDFFGCWDQDVTFVVGHTPTFKLGKEHGGRIFRNGNFVDLDCGCVAGHRLGALCLDTGEEFYVDLR